MESIRSIGLVTLCIVGLGVAASAASPPMAVSPGSARGGLIKDGCPTFSWSQVAGATGYQIVVYSAEEDKEAAPPLLAHRVSGAALTWTPTLERCLDRGGRYAWSVRALGAPDEPVWSAPRLFEVTAGPNQAEFEEALAVVRQYLVAQEDAEANTSLDQVPHPQLGGPGTTVAAEPGPDPVHGGSRPAPAIATDTPIGIGTQTPDGSADLHVVGTDPDPGHPGGNLLITPSVAGAPDPDGVARITLGNGLGTDFSYTLDWGGNPGLLLLQNGTTPRMYFHSGFQSVDFIGSTLYADGSALTDVDAVTLDTLDSTDFELKLPAGTDGQVLVADSGAPTGVAWSSAEPDMIQDAKQAICDLYFEQAFAGAPDFCGFLRVFATFALQAPVGPGVSGFDITCRNTAVIAGLPNSGNFKAWLSDLTTNAGDRLVATTNAWIRVDGVGVAKNKADLLDGTILNPINRDQYGTIIDGGSLFDVWTGTFDSGTGTGTNCLDWASGSSSHTGTFGIGTATNNSWTVAGSHPCDEQYRIYCFEDISP